MYVAENEEKRPIKHANIHLKTEHADADIEPLVKKSVQATDKDYDLLVTDFCTVFEPNGEVLLKPLPRAISLDYCKAAFDAFHDALTDAKNSMRPAILNSGNQGSEGVLGFMDPVHRFNYCRTTALTVEHLEGFKESIPFLRSAASLMETHMPERYKAQLAECVKGHADYQIPGRPSAPSS